MVECQTQGVLFFGVCFCFLQSATMLSVLRIWVGDRRLIGVWVCMYTYIYIYKWLLDDYVYLWSISDWCFCVWFGLPDWCFYCVWFGLPVYLWNSGWTPSPSGSWDPIRKIEIPSGHSRTAARVGVVYVHALMYPEIGLSDIALRSVWRLGRTAPWTCLHSLTARTSGHTRTCQQLRRAPWWR